MKYCTACHAENSNYAVKCKACGKEAFYYICPRCDTRFRDGQSCPRCGLKAGAVRNVCPTCGEVYYTPSCPKCGRGCREQRPKKHTGRVICLVLLLLGAVGVLYASGLLKHTHEFGDWATVTEMTCTTNGLLERACSCGEKETEIIPAQHTILPATCTEPATCSVCGYTEGEPLGHLVPEGEYRCQRCGWYKSSGFTIESLENNMRLKQPFKKAKTETGYRYSSKDYNALIYVDTDEDGYLTEITIECHKIDTDYLTDPNKIYRTLAIFRDPESLTAKTPTAYQSVVYLLYIENTLGGQVDLYIVSGAVESNVIYPFFVEGKPIELPNWQITNTVNAKKKTVTLHAEFHR